LRDAKRSFEILRKERRRNSEEKYFKKKLRGGKEIDEYLTRRFTKVVKGKEQLNKQKSKI